ncbi:MAG: serine/threonine protein kinase [Candidatus Brocadiae bacterium]|nr:serine/threonine protein kinase [Candidatus Brocadiia bacterium]
MSDPDASKGQVISADAAFAALIEEASARLEAGEPVDVEALCAQHPRHAERLRRLLPTLHAVADLGQSVTEPSETDRGGEPLRELGDFRIMREVGRGGMGVVYEAEQVSLKRRVALKVLPFAAVLDQRQLDRFGREAEAAGALHHQNIVPVYSVGCERGVHFYAMQFINGHTLGELIGQLREASGLGPAGRPATTKTARKTPPHPPRPDATTLTLPEMATTASTTQPAFFRSVAQLGIQVAEALDHAHQQGVVHRDIKPSNLMVDAQGKPWITDFGLAHVEAGPSLTVSGDLLGTLRYMSPEQAMATRFFAASLRLRNTSQTATTCASGSLRNEFMLAWVPWPPMPTHPSTMRVEGAFAPNTRDETIMGAAADAAIVLRAVRRFTSLPRPAPLWQLILFPFSGPLPYGNGHRQLRPISRWLAAPASSCIAAF